ncbi:MAG: enoyl-CoA hydratase [Parvibaculum sp.]
MPSPTERMIARKEGSIGWMIFNNPERHNAVSLDMWQAIPIILDEFEADPEIRTIILTGAGDKAFVAGADISQFEETRSSPDKVQLYEDISTSAFDRIANSNRPTIAMIDGYCIGGGLGIALACDIRIAAEGSTFGIPAGKLGLAYPLSSTKRLVDVVGPAFAKEIFFTAQRFTHNEALAMGLINRVTTKVELEQRIRGMAAEIDTNAPLTLRNEKKIIDHIIREADSFDKKACMRLIAECFGSADYAEGRTAFMEKRKPVFTGK